MANNIFTIKRGFTTANYVAAIAGILMAGPLVGWGAWQLVGERLSRTSVPYVPIAVPEKPVAKKAVPTTQPQYFGGQQRGDPAQPPQMQQQPAAWQQQLQDPAVQQQMQQRMQAFQQQMQDPANQQQMQNAFQQFQQGGGVPGGFGGQFGGGGGGN